MIQIHLFKVICTLFMFSAAGLQALSAQNPASDNLEWVGMEQALRLASEDEKLILIDVYTQWCPYCQRMQSEVYPHENIEKLVEKYFVPVRIDVESDHPLNYLGTRYTEAEFARALDNQNVPTTYFMNANGEVVGQQPGLLPVDDFSELLEYVGSGVYETMTFREFRNRQAATF